MNPWRERPGLSRLAFRRCLPLALASAQVGCGWIAVDTLEVAYDSSSRPVADASTGLDSNTAPDAQEPNLCGNGNDDPEELCDDGNNEGGDGCEASCVPTFRSLQNIQPVLEAPADLASLSPLGMSLVIERSNYILPTDQVIDQFALGSLVFPGAGAGVIPAGSRVHIFLLHLPAGNDRMSGVVEFAIPLLGVIHQDALLFATDSPDIVYSAVSSGRGPEAGVMGIGDTGTLGERSLETSLKTGTSVDEIRLFMATEEEHGIVVAAP